MNSFQHKHLLSLADLSREDYYFLFDTAKAIRKKHRDGWPHTPLAGKILAMIFEKRSTRTRASFFAAMVQMGGIAVEYRQSDLHVGEGKESDRDNARAIGLFSDGIVIRCYRQGTAEDYARHSGVSVINGLTDSFHPCQVLADMLTLHELVGDLDGFRITYIGRPNNITNTLIQSCLTLGIQLTIGYPAELEARYIGKDFEQTLAIAKTKELPGEARIRVSHDPVESVRSAQAIYTDTWFNTGESMEDDERVALRSIMQPFQVNSELMSKATPGAYFLHCLPADREKEVTSEVIDNLPTSMVWKQAENRLHIQKAILEVLLAI